MISVASSIKFRPVVSGALPSFDTVFHEDETYLNSALTGYCQKFTALDTEVLIQVKVLTGYTIAAYYSEGEGGEWQSIGSGTLEVDGAEYDYYEIEIDFSTFTDLVRFRIDILDGATVEETWYSEPCQLTTETLQKVEFFNLENAFEVDYSTGIAHLLRVDGELKEYKPGGETTVFDNQNEVTKIKGELKRTLVFRTEPIPRYLAEMLACACMHDKFFINEVEYVAEGNAEYENNASTLGVFSVTLTQRNVIGLNTHDIGYDCDTQATGDSMVLEELAASGQKSFTIPDDYMILSITGNRVAGDPVVKAGITPGGDEILYEMNLSTGNPTEVSLVPTDKNSVTGGTLYVDISGAGATANIYIILLKNRQ